MSGVIRNVQLPARTLKSFGARCDGSDETAVLIRALSSGVPVVLREGTLGVKAAVILAPCDFTIAAGATLKLLPTGDASPGLSLNGAGSKITAYGLIDGGQTGRSAVVLGATANYSEAWLYDVQNVSCEATSGTHPSGLEVLGGVGQRFYANVRNCPNNLPGQAGAAPRAVTVQGYADKVVGEVDADNVWVGVVLATTTAHITRAKVTNAGLEALYNLNGSNTVGELHYGGQYQAFVNEADIRIGRVIHEGGNPPTGAAAGANGGATIALQNAGVTEVGIVQLVRNGAPVGGAGTLVTVRTANVRSGAVRIGAVQGVIRPVALTSLGYHGAVQSIDIQQMDVTVEYDPAVMVTPLNFADLTVCEEFTLRDWRVNIVDVTNAYAADNATYFRMQLPVTPLRPSFVEDVRCFLFEQDGTTLWPPAQFPNVRIYNGAHPLVYTKGMVWEGGIACMREANAYNAAEDGSDAANLIPTAGAWRAGKYLRNWQPVETGQAGSKYVLMGWQCVQAGTPGVWVQDRATTGN